MQAGAPYGDEAKMWDGRDVDLEGLAAKMQDFVQYLIDNDSPLAERYGNKVPSHEEALVIAKRMGGAFRTSQAWPNPKTVFERQANEVDAERFPSTATGRAGRTRTPSGTAAWTTTCRTSCMRACASRATS